MPPKRGVPRRGADSKAGPAEGALKSTDAPAEPKPNGKTKDNKDNNSESKLLQAAASPWAGVDGQDEEIRVARFELEKDVQKGPTGKGKCKGKRKELSAEESSNGEHLYIGIEAPEEKKYLRRRVPAAVRHQIWTSTDGRCYLCKQNIPQFSSWHIEHVVAFSRDPLNNDVLGNMLPACAKCNLKKNDRTLKDLIAADKTLNLMTEAPAVAHLNTAARTTLLIALNVKRDRERKLWDEILRDAVEELEQRTDRASKSDSGPHRDLVDTYLTTLRKEKLVIESHEVEYFGDDRPISMGSFGEVYACRLLRSNGRSPSKVPKQTGHDRGSGQQATNDESYVAVKKLRLGRDQMTANILHEVEVLRRVQHPNIVRFVGVLVAEPGSKAPFSIVMEYCSHSLNNQVAIENVDPIKVMLEIADALAFMHSKDYVHRDVKPNNILINKTRDQHWHQAVAKLCDMGSSKLIDADIGGHTTNAGTGGYRPPEMRNGILGPKSDVYSFGKTMENLRAQNEMLQGSGELADRWDAVAKQALAKDYEKRPDMAHIRERLRGLLNEPESKGTSKNSASPPPIPASKSRPPAPGPLGSLAAAATSVIASIIGSSLPSPPARGVHTLSPTKSKSDDPPPIQQPSQMVFVTSTARRREFPAGRTKMSYHIRETCSSVVRSTVCKVSEKEAEEFDHKRCHLCYK